MFVLSYVFHLFVEVLCPSILLLRSLFHYGFFRGFIFSHLKYSPLFSHFSLTFNVYSYTLGNIAIFSILKESQEDQGTSVCYLCGALGISACQKVSDWSSPMGLRNTKLPGHQRQVFKGRSLCGLPYMPDLAGPRRSTRPRQSCLPALAVWGLWGILGKGKLAQWFGGAEPQKYTKAG